MYTEKPFGSKQINKMYQDSITITQAPKEPNQEKESPDLSIE
jgi:hypothetical protein